MQLYRFLSALPGALFLVATASAPAVAETVQPVSPTATVTSVRATAACESAPQAGHARCLAEVNSTVKSVVPGRLPAGFGPSDLQSAYNVVSSANYPAARFSRTIAVVDAYDDPLAH